MAWGDTILSVHHLRTPRSFRIGPDDECDLYVPEEYTGARNVPVLLDGPGRALRAVIPSNASGVVQLPGQPGVDLKEAVKRGLAQPCPDIEQAHQVYLTPGMRVSICLSRRHDGPHTPYRRRAVIDDSLVVTIAWVEQLRWSNAWSRAALAVSAAAVIGSAAAHAGAIATIAYASPSLLDSDELSLDHEVSHRWYAMTKAFGEDPDPPEPVVRDTLVLAGSVVVDQEIGSSGEMGDRRGVDAPLRWGNQGPQDNPDPHLGLPGIKEWQYGWETCCFFPCQPLPPPESGSPSSPAAREDSLGLDVASARGKNVGPLMGNARGTRGLGRSGREIGGPDQRCDRRRRAG